jgi:uncharacterized membrane protein YjfL (UPF0719 family)
MTCRNRVALAENRRSNSKIDKIVMPGPVSPPLILLALLYRLAGKGVDAALDEQNLAVGISLAGFLLSGGMVCGAVISGPSQGWRSEMITIALYLSAWIFLMLMAHFISDKLTFRSSRLGEEVMEQRNIAAALFKAVIFISLTLGYTHG